MALDSLKTGVKDYVEKKADLSEERTHLDAEILKAESLGEGQNLEKDILDHFENIRTGLGDEERDLQSREEALNEFKKELTSEITKEKKNVSTAKEKIDSLSENRYADALKKAAAKSDELLDELSDLLDTLDESTDGSAPANSIITVDGTRYRTDDSGQIHMQRSSDGEYYVLPNKTYTVNGYTYQSDDQGRIIHAEGKIRVSGGTRKSLNTTVPDMGKFDQRGHIIADLFGGSNMNDNLVAQLSSVNDGAYKALEKKLADLTADHAVYAQYEILYADDTKRPACITVTYTVDGEEQMPYDFWNYEDMI